MTPVPRSAVNASPLIFLGKIGQLDQLPDPVATTPTVLDEVLAGDPLDHPEVDLIQALVDEEQIRVQAPDEPLGHRITGLDPGEASLLSMAREEGIEEVIVDDKVAIRTAKLLGLTPVSTPFLLVRACREERLTVAGFRRCLDRLIEHRYFLSPDLYQRLIEVAGEHR